MRELNDNEMENEAQAPKKKRKIFNIFDWFYKDGKVDEKDDIKALEHPTFANFFRLLWKKLGKLMSANLIMVFGNFPIIFLLLATSGILSKTSVAPLYQTWAPLAGVSLFQEDAVTTTLSAIYGVHTEVNVINTPTKVFFLLGLLIIFTWGFTKVGTTYIYRNLMSGEAVFPFSDFIYVAKRNIKQSLIFGIIDVAMIAILAYNSYFLLSNYALSTMNAVMLFLTVAMTVVYFFMRPYIYIMIFTFDLSMGQIIKNALYFVLLGAKRNFAVLGGTLVLVAINYALFLFIMPIGIILPFVITISIADFAGVYGAYPKILQYMVEKDDEPQTEEE